MMIKRTSFLVVMAALVLLWIASDGGLRSLADEPVVRNEARSVSAVSPLLQYQGRLADPSTGEAVADDTYSMTFGLYDVDSGGTPLWTETKDVAVQGGLFSTALGDTATLDAGLFNGQALWLGITVGADAEATPRQQVLPVAYALSLVPGATISDSSSEPILNVVQGGTGAGGYFTSTTTYGVEGRTASTSPGQAGVLGVAGGWASHDLPFEAGVLGKSANHFGVAGVSDDFVGTMGRSDTYYGVWGESHGTYAGVRAASWGGGQGLYAYSTDNHGVYGQGDTTTDHYGGYFTGGGGVYGRGVYHGGYFTSTDGSGVWAGSYSGSGVYGAASATTGWAIGVQGETASEGGDGVYGHATATTGAAYALNGRTHSEGGRGAYGYASSVSGTRVGVQGEVNGSGYGLYTTDDLYVGGTCTGCTLVHIARNTSQETLRVGDVVAVSGVGPVLAEHTAPVLQVRQATASDASVLGVVYCRGEFYAASGGERASDDSVQPVAGDVAPGDYLMVVTNGLAQVRVAPALTELAPGQKLAVGEVTGRATLAGTDANPDLVFARAMEAKPDENGLLWALVTVQ
ncbi:MAG: hypothetical protein PVF45_14555 [Anaerolineae bacterium]|jgi:hypothetical protein